MTDFRYLGTLILVLRRGIERERERIARAEIRIAEYRAELTELGVDPETGEALTNAALSGRTRSDEAAGSTMINRPHSPGNGVAAAGTGAPAPARCSSGGADTDQSADSAERRSPAAIDSAATDAGNRDLSNSVLGSSRAGAARGEW